MGGMTSLVYTFSRWGRVHCGGYDIISIHTFSRHCGVGQRRSDMHAQITIQVHYKFSALMSLQSRDNVQTELVVIRACMSDLLWG